MTVNAPGLQNGAPDGIALVDGTTLVQFLSYEGAFAATNGPASGRTSTDVLVGETGFELSGQSLQLTGSGSTYGDFTWARPARSTRDGVNNNQTLNGQAGPAGRVPADADCLTPGPSLTAIPAVQGAGASTPIPADQTVQVEGVVVGDLENVEAGGFFLQSEVADTDPATSEGLFVASPATATVNIGEVRRAAGLVAEVNGVTTLLADDVSPSCRLAAVPAPGTLALPSNDVARERLEGMRVTPAAPLTVTEHFNLDRFGELVLSSSGAQVQPTEVARPGSAQATALIAANRLNRITLDDGRGAQNLLPVPYLTRTDSVRIGDRVAVLEEVVLTFGFGTWRLQPADGDVRDADATTFDATNPRPANPDAVGGTYKVGAFNVLNYFTSVPSGNGPRDPRGADSVAELREQEAKIVAAINLLGADVVALQEIENSAALGEATDEALATLVSALNAAAGAGTWAFVPSSTDLPPASDQDVITNAIIYKPGRVTTVGRSRSLTDEVNFDNAREPVAQTFSAAGDVFTVIGNHLKSKSGTGTGANADTGQGNFNGDRVGQAQVVLTFAEQLRSETGDSDVIVLGDLNAYTQEDPVDVLRRGGFRDLVETEKPGDYSYVFNGLSGSLDHAMASIPLSQKVTGVDVWNINSPEPDAYQYDAVPALYTADQYRSSDHDPVVVGLDLGLRTPTPYDVQVLGINDFHGRLEPPTAEDTRAVPPRPSVGGAAFLASAVNTFRDELRNTTFVSAGDNIGASPFASAVAQDAPAIAVLDAMGLEVTSVGNHEFDRGYADLAGRVANLAGFPFLGANVVGEAPELPTRHTVTLPDGVTIGTIGVTTEQTGTLVSPAGIRGITFADIVASANAVADELTDGNPANGEADVLVLMAHEGPATGATTAAQCQATYDRQDAFGAIARGVSNKVDAIIAGHTHQVVNCQLPNPGSKSDLDLRPVLEAGEYGQSLDRLRFTWNPLSRTISNLRTEVVPIRSKSSNPSPATGFDPDPVVQRIVTDAVAAARVLGRPVIGSITADIKRAFTPTGTEDRGSESVLGNFVADVQLDAVNQPDQPGAQIAFMNPGGLRTDLLVNRLYGVEQPGEITFGEAADVQPFANTLFTLSLTGAQVKQVLEQQYQPAGATRPFLALGVSRGFFFLTDGTQPVGSRISGITLNGVALDPAASYRIVTNSFLASGGDNFPALAGGTNRVDTGLDDLRALVEFFGRNSPVTADTAPRRAVAGSQAPAPGPAPGPTQPPATPTAGMLALDRLAGNNRYETAARIARGTFARAETVLLANGQSDDPRTSRNEGHFPDALAAAYLAGARQAPTLLATETGLPAVSRDALTQLGARNVVIVGGTSAISTAVESRLRADGFTVTRVGGVDRYETARRVAQSVPTTTVGTAPNGDRTAVVASGQDFADALVAGPLGYAVRFPILITPTARLSAQTRTALQGLGIKRVILPGGTSAVSTSVENEIKALGITVQRFGGQVRSETAALVAAYAYDRLDFDRSHVDLARGDQFPDALTGGPHAGAEHAPILLTATPTSLGTATEAFLRNRGAALRDGHVFGGTSAVSTATEEAAERAAATR